MTEGSTTENILFDNSNGYEFPNHPFESIGFALSGGGFRAASYGLGVLSMLDAVKTNLQQKQSLLDNVTFFSSASGGTISLMTYLASKRAKMSFKEFFLQLDRKLTGENMLHEALEMLADDGGWEQGGKTRNLINAFALVYHDSLFDFLKPEQRNLGYLMDTPEGERINPEFCFNASEFYTGLSFRFQGSAQGWASNRGGRLGNANIGLNREDTAGSIATMKKMRLGDVLAASSCFPMGFEPIMFPRDFAYKGGPDKDNLRTSLKLDTHSWGNGPQFTVSNNKSKRAKDEKAFADNKEFGLMDGGICDNQGLWSLLEANKRTIAGDSPKTGVVNRFDLMMVSDVTSFYMKPYKSPKPFKAAWAGETPAYYWDLITGIFAKVKKARTKIFVGTVLTASLFCLPLLLEGPSVAGFVLAALGLAIFGLVVLLDRRYEVFIKARPNLEAAFRKKSLEALFTYFRAEDTFTNRTSLKLISHLKTTNIEVLIDMLLVRGQSTVTMVSEVFLKHVRRLIYDQLFRNPAYQYRRLDNPIYRLSYTNAKNRRQPSFEEQGGEDDKSYRERKERFLEEVGQSCKLTDTMQEIAEIAYNADTTLWFTQEEETDSPSNVRRAIIAAGQFTTCYSLLRYALSIKHSRCFKALHAEARTQTEFIISQLKAMMLLFEKDPFFLYLELTNDHKHTNPE